MYAWFWLIINYIVSSLCCSPLTLTCYIFQREHKHIFTFYVTPPHWHVTGSWNPSSSMTRTYLLYVVNIMGTDDLATQWARASAAMIFTMFKHSHDIHYVQTLVSAPVWLPHSMIKYIMYYVFWSTPKLMESWIRFFIYVDQWLRYYAHLLSFAVLICLLKYCLGKCVYWQPWNSVSLSLNR